MLDEIIKTLREKDSLVVSALVDYIGLSEIGEVGGVLRFHFCLDALKFPDGSLYKKEVVVRGAGSEEFLRSFKLPIKPKSIIKIKIKFTEEFEIGAQALLEEVIDYNYSDDELVKFRDYLEKPLVIIAPNVGKMTYDRKLNWFSGSKFVFPRKVEITLSPKSEDTPEELYPKLEAVAKNLGKLNRSAKRFASDSLLELKNSGWVENWYERVNPLLFKLRMSLNSVSINDDNTFEFWYNDGGLFYGHSIKVFANKENEFINCDIVG